MKESESESIAEERREDADDPDEERRCEEVGMEESEGMICASSSLAWEDLRALKYESVYARIFLRCRDKHDCDPPFLNLVSFEVKEERTSPVSSSSSDNCGKTRCFFARPKN